MPGKTDKTAILSLVSARPARFARGSCPMWKPSNLRKVLFENVDAGATHLHTDRARNYRLIAGDFASHEAVNHHAREWVRGDVSTNQAEAFFSQLKRSLDGTHRHVAREHLDRYLAEFDFRYTTRHDWTSHAWTGSSGRRRAAG